jgi:uncharacterized membrane protein YfcA
VNPPPRNPYEPPGAAVNDVAPSSPGSPLKAVIYGILVDIGGSIGAGLVLVLVYSIVLASSGASVEDIQRAVSEPQPLSWFSIVGFLVGCAASFLGGYVCARVSAANEMKWVGIVAAVSGVVSLLMGMDAYAFEWNAVLALVGMAAVFAGGWTGARRNRRSA